MPIHRVVAEEHRALSLGFLSLVTRVLGGVPGALITGYLFDASCEHWQYQCGERGNCWVYDNQTLAYLILGFAILILGTGAILGIGLWLTYPKSTAQGKIEHKISAEDDAPLPSSSVEMVNDVKANERGVSLQDKVNTSERTGVRNGENHVCSNGKIDKETPV